ncbi:hypothetical protein ACX8Z9_04625 [Arthrobacter halodurans]|uniref:Metallothionein n=1 Tax=Arthrobacter halodurans TaxID=516699 RepID=A0ABV4UPX3_9MICC
MSTKTDPEGTKHLMFGWCTTKQCEGSGREVICPVEQPHLKVKCSCTCHPHNWVDGVPGPAAVFAQKQRKALAAA